MEVTYLPEPEFPAAASPPAELAACEERYLLKSQPCQDLLDAFL